MVENNMYWDNSISICVCVFYLLFELTDELSTNIIKYTYTNTYTVIPIHFIKKLKQLLSMFKLQY